MEKTEDEHPHGGPQETSHWGDVYFITLCRELHQLGATEVTHGLRSAKFQRTQQPVVTIAPKRSSVDPELDRPGPAISPDQAAELRRQQFYRDVRGG